jgi:hypothetical protein
VRLPDTYTAHRPLSLGDRSVTVKVESPRACMTYVRASTALYGPCLHIAFLSVEWEILLFCISSLTLSLRDSA